MEVAETIKKQPKMQPMMVQPSSVTPALTTQVKNTTVVNKTPAPQVTDDMKPPKKKKQKIISTGAKGINPKEKLYCVCRTPYDDTK